MHEQCLHVKCHSHAACRLVATAADAQLPRSPRMQIYTANCGMNCETVKLQNGRWGGGYVYSKSAADTCCYWHDIDLHNSGISGSDKRACSIHAKLYNCMKSRRSPWGQSIALDLWRCVCA